MDWMKEIDFNKLKNNGDVDCNAELIIKECGVDVLLKLIELFGKSSIYFSEKLIFSLKREYICQKRHELSVKQMSRALSVSEKYIYNVVNDLNASSRIH